MNQENQREQVDALCPECSQGFKAYVDRILPEEHQGHGTEALKGVECPHCGCHECKIDESVR